MKLKSLFLCMLGAAVFVGCNNEIDGPGPGTDTEKDVIEGLSVYASLKFNVNGPSASTYAGVDDQGASDQEKEYTDAAMFVYRYDGVSAYPQAAVYIANMHTPDYSDRITMKATSGRKKIFVALNPKQGTNLIPLGSAGTVSTELNTLFTSLNNVLYTAAPGTGQNFGLTSTAVFATKADGLIRTLAKGKIRGNADGDDYEDNDYDMLMTNWDGLADNSSKPSSWGSSCEFTLVADIDSAASNGGGAAQNNFAINVQRAFAKISLSINPAIKSADPIHYPVGATFATEAYMAADGETYAGAFQPWTATNAAPANGPVWALGNINKETIPFQQWAGGYPKDMNYLALNDSIKVSFTKWASRYDNTRVFPTSMTVYPDPVGNTVAAVKTQMLTTGNWENLSVATYNYAYAPENAREYPVAHDFGTYLVIGGRYNPKRVGLTVERASVETNLPTIDWKDDYTYEIQAADTVYYDIADGVFVIGKNNILGYYAWQKKIQQGAPADYSGFNSDVIDAVQDAIDGKRIMAYVGGQCWYRIFITDPTAGQGGVNSLLRNHIYRVNIAAIKGPGISDPNDIIIPGTPIPELDTYVTAHITILPWHVVEHDKEVDQNW